ncbi:FmdB family zinc ribbon protein [Paenarthrobacter sp. PH39-S1]|uniref:FmdB family zinc ribbon protein n=1 Tax=Paenarthrobacter sp. PH39-S1 TaxID=3046204 RepID=UPI0024BBC697|nr:FmdB family zinc ribbon protein [Paenarthrobacter sp. PH39-S1]MDJ0358069.1 zinc ribbon domain-containing protein [Paenarthrobacter sp. PH39-S1]
MPTYAYACKDCGHAFDIVQSFSDNSLTDCPSCDGALRKKFNSVGVVFKGPGFYRTDSRDSKGAGVPAAGKGSSAKESVSAAPAAAAGARSSTSSGSSNGKPTVSAGKSTAASAAAS